MSGVAVNDFQFRIRHASRQLFLLAKRVQDVGIDSEDAHGDFHVREDLFDGSSSSSDVVGVHLRRRRRRGGGGVGVGVGDCVFGWWWR